MHINHFACLLALQAFAAHQLPVGCSSSSQSYSSDHRSDSDPSKDPKSDQQYDHNNKNHFEYDPEGFWAFAYVDEEEEGFNPIVEEKTIDERLANVVHIVSGSRILDYVTHDFASGDPDEDELNLQVAGSSPVVNDDLCGHHLSQMLQQIDELEQRLERTRQSTSADVSLNLTEQHYRLARVLDSFGRYESGHLLGRTHSAGSYEECVGSQLLLASAEKAGAELVKSRYCWAKLSINKHLHQTLKVRARETFESMALMWVAICIPESCHSKSFQKHPHLFSKIANSQFKLPKGIYLDENLHLDSVYCLLDRDSSFGVPLAGKLWFCFVGLWTMLAIYGTFFADNSTDSNTSTSLFSRIVCCLDLRRSWADFMESKKDNEKPKRVDFDTLNPIKVIGTQLVVLGHCLVVQVSSPMDFLRAAFLIERHPMTLVSLASTMVVDSFLVITGILVAFFSINKIQKSRGEAGNKPNQSIQVSEFLSRWAQITAHRFLRLMPMFYLVFWFQKGVLINVGGHQANMNNGFNVETLPGACRRETWLSPLIGLSAFLPISRQCLPQTWTISVDLIFSFTLAPLIVLYCIRPKLASIISVLLCLVSVIWGQILFYRLDPKSVEQVDNLRALGMARMFSKAFHLYTWPQLRLSSVSVGLLAGYHLFQYNKQGENSTASWPKWLTGWATKVSLSTVVGAIFIVPSIIPKLSLMAGPYHRLFFVHAVSTLRFVWSAANAILFMRMLTDWKNRSNFTWTLSKFWKILVNLNYSILLIHVPFLVFHISLQETFVDFTWLHVLAVYSITLLFCLPASVLLYVLFENPFNKIVASIIQPKFTVTRSKSE